MTPAIEGGLSRPLAESQAAATLWAATGLPTAAEISKIRLTKEFKGNLPDGTPVDLKNLKLKDVFDIYPKLKDTWGSRSCSDYWSFANDTLFFYVKIDTTKKPQFPIDEDYYSDKLIEAIDL